MKQKGTGVFLVVGVFLMVLIVGISAFVGFTQQSVVTSPEVVKELATATASAQNKGDASSLKTVAKDLEANAKDQIATTLYVEAWDGEAVGKGKLNLIENAKTLSASTTTSTATSIGTHIKACAFSSTYYGDCKEFEVTKETEPVTLDSYAITSALTINCVESGVEEGESTSTLCNITMGASQTSKFDSLRIEQAIANKAFNFKMLAFNTSSTTDLNDIEVLGNAKLNGEVAGVFAEGNVPRRLKNTHDYAFEVPTAIMLHGFDELETPPVKLVASGTNPDEEIGVTVIDETKFVSVKTATLDQILSGVETDATVEASVGMSDEDQAIYIQ